MHARLRKLAYLLSHPRALRTFAAYGVVPTVDLLPILAGICPKTVVDVGANRGQFALLARWEMATERLIMIEPLSDCVVHLNTLFAADDNVRILEGAAGAEERTATVNVSADPDSSSLLAITERQAQEYPGTQKAGEQTTQVFRLDQVLDCADLVPPVLLKIDVQGFELEVLRGAKDLLDCVDWILVEVSFSELYEGQPLAGHVIAWLAEHEFLLASGSWSSGRISRGPLQGDLIFARRTVR